MEWELLPFRDDVNPMNTNLFESFSKMIEEIPAQGIIPAVELERRMLAEDLAHSRTVAIKEVRSILSFCRFIEAAQSGVSLPPTVLPATETEFYRRTTARLIEAGELPFEAKEKFDATFSAPLLKTLIRSFVTSFQS